MLPFACTDLACFLASLRSRRAGSDALAALRSSFESEASFVPRFGSPFGTTTGSFGDLVLADDVFVLAFAWDGLSLDGLAVGVDFGVAPGRPLHL